MSESAGPDLRRLMAGALTASMKARDPVAVAALRSALARVGNAEAVPVDTVPRAGAIEHSAVGLGAAEAPRRTLTESDVREVVEAEVAEHERAARHLRDAGRPDDAAAIAAQADVLRSLLAGAQDPLP